MITFTPKESKLLKDAGWEVNCNYAEYEWKQIAKKSVDRFVLSVCITDPPDGNDYWEFDSEYTDLVNAILGRAN